MIDRLGSLEGRVERLALAVGNLAATVGGLAQQLWQTAAGNGGGGQGNSGLIPAVITSNVTAGSEASPTTFTFNSELASGTGFTTSGGISGGTGYNRFAGTSFSASGGSPKSCWLMQRADGNYYLVVADC